VRDRAYPIARRYRWWYHDGQWESSRSWLLSSSAGGASIRRRYGKGDHWVYTHSRRRFPLTIDPRRPLLPVYVSKAIRAIEEVLADENA
jgi:hypothetical protein